MRAILIPAAQEDHYCRRVVSALETRGMTLRVEGRETCLAGLDCRSSDAVLVCAGDDMPTDEMPTDVIHAVRAAAGHRIVAVLGDLDQAARLDALEAGADDCLPGGMSGDELHQRLVDLLRIPVSENGRDAVLEVEDLRIGLMHLDVFLGSERLRLNKREYQILRYLALNNGRIIPRNELIEQVWGIGAQTNENTLDVYMHRLRNKVGTSADTPPLILTVRGFGYCLGCRDLSEMPR